MGEKRTIFLFHNDVIKLLFSYSPIILLELVLAINKFFDKQNQMGLMWLIFAMFFITLALGQSKMILFFITKNEIINMKASLRKMKYNVFFFKDVKAYQIKKNSLKIQFESGEKIFHNLYFFCKEDRELLKQLLAERVPVKPS